MHNVRKSIQQQVELCAYVQALDEERRKNPTCKCDSFRNVTWKQRKQQEIAQRYFSNVTDSDGVDSNSSTQPTQSRPPSSGFATHGKEPADVAKDLLEPVDAEQEIPGVDDAVSVSFEDVVNDILRHDVELSYHVLPAKASDPLGAISIPCKREGNSLTLCCYHEQKKLVVFGGRLLRDVTKLLPDQATRGDPMKLERVKYAYSNAVYAYDLVTGTWTLKDCKGKLPRARSDHTAVFLEPYYLLVLGGRGRNGQIFRDCFALSFTQWQWVEIDTEYSPIERYWHGCGVDEHNVFVFGGKSDIIVHGDLQQLDVSALKNTLKITITSPGASTSTTDKATLKKLVWRSPHTVGSPPSARFGMRLVMLDDERLAILGGWKASKIKKKQPQSYHPPAKPLDVYILDIATMVWSRPRLASTVCALSTPTERMLFECFYAHRTLVIFGGYTYATNGVTEAFTAREDVNTAYKLDVGRMIWRRQRFSEHDVLPTHCHASSNAVLNDSGFTCAFSETLMQLELLAVNMEPKHRITSTEPHVE